MPERSTRAQGAGSSNPHSAQPAFGLEARHRVAARGDKAVLSIPSGLASESERGTYAKMKDGKARPTTLSEQSLEGVATRRGGLNRRKPTSKGGVGADAVSKSLMATSSVARGLLSVGSDHPERIQSTARPFGLEVMAPVQATGSDSSSEAFEDEVLPDLLNYIESNVVYNASNELMSAEATLTNLTLTAAAAVRVYFVAEDGAYHNSIGLFTGESSDADMLPELLFPDASSSYSYWKKVPEKGATADLPLIPGDFIDVGIAEAGSSLDFFVIPDGARQRQDAYGVVKEMNEDGLSHARILGFVGDSMILLGFEDLPDGGDKDYDDVIVAVEVGRQNVQSISALLGLQGSPTNLNMAF